MIMLKYVSEMKTQHIFFTSEWMISAQKIALIEIFSKEFFSVDHGFY